MSEHLLNPTALRAAQPRQAPPSMPIGEGYRLFGFALVPFLADDGETIRVAMVADVGKPSPLTDAIPVARVFLGDYGTTTKAELRAKFEEASSGQPTHGEPGQ